MFSLNRLVDDTLAFASLVANGSRPGDLRQLGLLLK